MANYNDLIKAGLLNAGDRRTAGLQGLIALGQSIGTRSAPRLSPTPPPLDLAGPMAVFQNSMNTALQRGALVKKMRDDEKLRAMMAPQPVNEATAQRRATGAVDPIMAQPAMDDPGAFGSDYDGWRQGYMDRALPLAREQTTVPTALQGVPASLRPFLGAVGQVNPTAAIKMAGNLMAKQFTKPSYKIEKIGENQYGRVNSNTGVVTPIEGVTPSTGFGGTGIDNQTYNAILSIGPKIRAGTASQEEVDKYTLAYGRIGRERIETRQDSGTGASYQVRVPAQDLRAFPLPPGVAASDSGSPSAPEGDNGRRVGGGLPPKPSDGQAKSLSFFKRFELHNPILDRLEKSFGADVFLSQAQVMAEAIPGIGEYLQQVTMTPAQKEYATAAMDWIRAKLRKDSGAVIGPQEAKDEYKTHFPVPGNDVNQIAQKRRLREVVTQGMKDEALPASIYTNAVRNAQGVTPQNKEPEKLPTLDELSKKFGLVEEED